MLRNEDQIDQELLRLTLLRAPNEAVGLILSDGRVVELVNRSDNPTSNFSVARDDLLELVRNDPSPLEVSLWHSHPAGGLGPSRIDLQNKTPLKSHLVVSLVDGAIVSSWY